jgi:hypothetical protein
MSKQTTTLLLGFTLSLLAVLVVAAPGEAQETWGERPDPMADVAQRISQGADGEAHALFLSYLCTSRFARIGDPAREVIDAHYGVFMPLFLRYQHPGCARQVDLELHDWFMARATPEQDSAMRTVLRMWLLAPDAPPCPFLPEGINPEPVQLGDRVTAAELLSDLADTTAARLIGALLDSIQRPPLRLSSRELSVCHYLQLAQARIKDPASAGLFVVTPGGSVRMTRNAADFQLLLVNDEQDTSRVDLGPILEALQHRGELVERVRAEPTGGVITLVFADGARASMAVWGDDELLLADNLRSRPNALVVRHGALRSAVAAAVARVERMSDGTGRRTSN